MKDYYLILGVHRTASKETIRNAYRKLAKKFHPDVNSSPEADGLLKAINEAYEILGDDEKRTQYDRPVHFQLEPEVPIQPRHRDPRYRRGSSHPPRESEAARLNQLKEEYRPMFLWICKFGLGLSLLLVLNVALPSRYSEEVITHTQFYRSTSRSSSSQTLLTNTGRKFTWYPESHSEINLEEGTRVVIRESAIFSTILSIKAVSPGVTVWAARIYTRLSFFPVGLFIASCLGIIFKTRANLVLNCGTVVFVSSIICFFLT